MSDVVAYQLFSVLQLLCQKQRKDASGSRVLDSKANTLGVKKTDPTPLQVSLPSHQRLEEGFARAALGGEAFPW